MRKTFRGERYAGQLEAMTLTQLRFAFVDALGSANGWAPTAALGMDINGNFEYYRAEADVYYGELQARGANEGRGGNDIDDE